MAQTKPTDKSENINVKAMMVEIREHLKKSKEMQADISYIVEKYIPLGTQQEIVISSFKQEGFEMKDFTNREWNDSLRDQYDTFLNFRKTMWVFPYRFWSHSLGIHMDFKDGILARNRSFSYYNNLILEHLP